MEEAFRVFFFVVFFAGGLDVAFFGRPRFFLAGASSPLCWRLTCCFIPVSLLKTFPHMGQGTATASSSMFFPKSSFLSCLMSLSPSFYVSFLSAFSLIPTVRLYVVNSLSSRCSPTSLTMPSLFRSSCAIMSPIRNLWDCVG